MPFNVFISYHSGDCEGQPERIKRRLEKNPNVRVFCSEINLECGDPWPEKLAVSLFECDVLIVLIGSRWRAADWSDRGFNSVVQMEVMIALKNPLKPRVFPFLVGVPKRKDIMSSLKENCPTVLRELFGYQMLKYTPAEFSSVERKIFDWAEKLERSRTKHVAFISSSVKASADSGQLSYFTAVATELSRSLEAEDTIDLVVKIPPVEDYDMAIQAQEQLLLRIRNEVERFRAIIVSPQSAVALAEIVAGFIKEHQDFPVLTIDKAYREGDKCAAVFSKAKVGLPFYSTADWYAGGVLAADCLAAHFDCLDVERPVLVLLKGLEGSEPREAGFLDRVQEVLPDAVVVREIDGGFERETARREFGKLIEDLECEKLVPVHGVFCCNDEMALGVEDALMDWNDPQKETAGHGPCVVGFDGIPEVKQSLGRSIRKTNIARAGEFASLLNSIDVDIDRQVRKLKTHLLGVLRNPKKNWESSEIRPKRVLNKAEQRRLSMACKRSLQERGIYDQYLEFADEEGVKSLL